MQSVHIGEPHMPAARHAERRREDSTFWVPAAAGRRTPKARPHVQHAGRSEMWTFWEGVRIPDGAFALPSLEPREQSTGPHAAPVRHPGSSRSNEDSDR